MKRLFLIPVFFLVVLFMSLFITQITGFAIIGTRLFITNETVFPDVSGGGGGGSQNELNLTPTNVTGGSCDIVISFDKTPVHEISIPDQVNVCVEYLGEYKFIRLVSYKGLVQTTVDDRDTLLATTHQTSFLLGVHPVIIKMIASNTVLIYSLDGLLERAPTQNLSAQNVQIIELDANDIVLSVKKVTIEDFTDFQFNENTRKILIRFENAAEWSLYVPATEPSDGKDLSFDDFQPAGATVAVLSSQKTALQVSLFSSILFGGAMLHSQSMSNRTNAAKKKKKGQDSGDSAAQTETSTTSDTSPNSENPQTPQSKETTENSSQK
ncbi:MAG TPA: hypothetical protein VK158_02490 [Acidobacteriota bacterium]|nr:hypothetical protein [Acidobacteriota bacterium]